MAQWYYEIGTLSRQTGRVSQGHGTVQQFRPMIVISKCGGVKHG